MRNFGPYFVGNALSASGGWFQNLASAIFVYQETHSALLLGVLNAFQFGPVLLLAPWTGQIADAFDRRRLLIWTQAVAACVTVTLAVLVWHGEATTWLVIGFAGVLGVVTAVSNPAQMALVGSLVPRDSLTQAVALNSMTFNLARAIGPAAAALVIAAFGIAPAFAINAISYLVLVAALLVITPTPYPACGAPRSATASPSFGRSRGSPGTSRSLWRSGSPPTRSTRNRPRSPTCSATRPCGRAPSSGASGSARCSRRFSPRTGSGAPIATSPGACFSSGVAWC